MKQEKSFLDISKRIAHNILELAYNKGEENLILDDVLVVVWEAVIYLDTKTLKPSDWTKKHVASMKGVLNNAKTLARYKNYTREGLREALYKERIASLEEEEDLKRLFLSDIILIDDVDENGVVVLNEKHAKSWSTINPLPLHFGVMPYEGEVQKKNKAKKKVVLTSVALDPDVEKVLQPFIDHYCNDWEWEVSQERYKWDAIDVFQEKFNIAAQDLSVNLKDSMSASDNLLAGPFYFPLGMLSKMAKYSTEETRLALRNLFDEDIPLAERCSTFLEDTEKILEENKKIGNFKAKDKSMQSIRAISVYLALRYPNQHYIYKQSVYYDFKNITGANVPSLSQFENVLVGYEMVCNEIRKILMKNDKLLSLHDASFPDDKSDYRMLTQDFLYYCSFHYSFLGHIINR